MSFFSDSYKLICPGCNASYIGQITRHLVTRVKKHLKTDSNFLVFKHLIANTNCIELRGPKFFQVMESVASS